MRVTVGTPDRKSAFTGVGEEVLLESELSSSSVARKDNSRSSRTMRIVPDWAAHICSC